MATDLITNGLGNVTLPVLKDFPYWGKKEKHTRNTSLEIEARRDLNGSMAGHL